MSALTPLSLGSSLTPRAPKTNLPKRKLFKWLPDGTLEFRIDWSSIESFLSCNRSAEYKLVHSRTSAPRSALVFGAAFHSALEIWYRNKDSIDKVVNPVSYEPMEEISGSIILTKENIIRDCAIAIDKTYAEYPANFVSDYRTSEYCVECFLKYVQQYEKEQLVSVDHNGQKLVEFSFAMPMGEASIETRLFNLYGFGELTNDEAAERNCTEASIKVHIEWTGIIDLVFSQNSEHWLCDHKTTSILSQDFFDGFEIAMQPVGYVTAARAALPDLNIRGFMVNVAACRKPTKTGTAFETHRRFFEYTPAQESEFKRDALFIVEEFLANLTNNYFPRKTTWCIGKYGKCPYFEVCSLPPEHRLEMLNSNNFIDNTWKPV